MPPPVDVIKVPVLNKDKEVVWEDCFVQLPHRTFSFLSEKNPQKFAQVYGSLESVRDWWAGVHDDDPKLLHHPLRDVAGYHDKCIPLRIHSDGVVMSTKHSYHAISYLPFLGVGQILKTQLLFGGMVKDCCCKINEHGVDTMHFLFKIFAWSLAAAFHNRHPILDWNVQPFDEDHAELAALANQKLSEQDFLPCGRWHWGRSG